MPSEYALSHSLPQHYGEYPSYNRHRKVGVPFTWRSISGRTPCGAQNARRTGFGGLRSKTLSPALSPERGTSSEHALSYSLSYPYGEYPSCKFHRIHREVGALFVGGYRRFAQDESKNRAFSTVFPYFMVKRNRTVDKIRCGRRECVRFPLARVVARSHTATRRTEHERQNRTCTLRDMRQTHRAKRARRIFLLRKLRVAPRRRQ